MYGMFSIHTHMRWMSRSIVLGYYFKKVLPIIFKKIKKYLENFYDRLTYLRMKRWVESCYHTKRKIHNHCNGASSNSYKHDTVSSLLEIFLFTSCTVRYGTVTGVGFAVKNHNNDTNTVVIFHVNTLDDNSSSYYR